MSQKHKSVFPTTRVVFSVYGMPRVWCVYHRTLRPRYSGKRSVPSDKFSILGVPLCTALQVVCSHELGLCAARGLVSLGLGRCATLMAKVLARRWAAHLIWHLFSSIEHSCAVFELVAVLYQRPTITMASHTVSCSLAIGKALKMRVKQLPPLRRRPNPGIVSRYSTARRKVFARHIYVLLLI